MLKAAKKKLKFWSKNKKRNKIPSLYHFLPPPPPPPCHCCTCNCSSAIQPSAPPLPPWLEDSTFPLSSTQSEHPDEVRSPPRAAAGGEILAPLVASPSYQQYMAPNPVYGIPIIVENSCRRERRRSFAVFGSVGDLGIRFIRCFCPCFRI